MGVAYAILAIAFSIISVAATIVVLVMLYEGKLTLPGSGTRKLNRAETKVQLLQIEHKAMILEMQIAHQREEMYKRALNPGNVDA